MASIRKFYKDLDSEIFMCTDITKDYVIFKSKDMDEDGDFTIRKVPIGSVTKQYKEVVETIFPKKDIYLILKQVLIFLIIYVIFLEKKLIKVIIIL